MCIILLTTLALNCGNGHSYNMYAIIIKTHH